MGSSKMTPPGLKLLFVCQLAHLLLSAENQEDKPDGKERGYIMPGLSGLPYRPTYGSGSGYSRYWDFGQFGNNPGLYNTLLQSPSYPLVYRPSALIRPPVQSYQPNVGPTNLLAGQTGARAANSEWFNVTGTDV